MALCGYLEETSWDATKKNRIGDKRGKVGSGREAAGSRRDGEEEKVRCQVFAYQEKRSLPEELHEDRCGEVAEDGLGLNEGVERASWRHRAHRMAEVEVSLSLFMEVNSLEVEEELSTMATLFCSKGMCGWEGGRERAEDGVEDFRSAEMEASERAWRSSDARNPCSGHQVAAVVHLDV